MRPAWRGIVAALALLALLSASAVRAQPAEVWIQPGDDVEAVVDASPFGSTFRFAPGTYFLPDPVEPRPGDSFVADGDVILTGAIQVGPAVPRGPYWVIERVADVQDPHGSCAYEWERCDFREDLFLDDVPLVHVGTLDAIGPGRWHYDVVGGLIVLGEDPAGRRVELSISPGAFLGNANGVTIRGFTVEKFANKAQRGAIHAYGVRYPVTPGSAWLIRDNLVQLNHGCGIMAGYGAQIIGNRVLQNGQLGIMSLGGQATVIASNEIAYNNFAEFRYHWEGAGTKFRRTTGLQVVDNHVHHNRGPGLWGDYDNIDSLYARNIVEYNGSTGIFHEISYAARIVDNVVRFNGEHLGETWYAYVFGSGILVYNSQNVEVAGNVVVGNWNGINGLQHDRGTGAHGPWVLRNLDVHDNIVHIPYNANAVRPGGGPGRGEGMQGVNGVSQADDQDAVFLAEANNRFHGNVYLIDDPNVDYWTWGDRRLTFDEWQTCGVDEAHPEAPWPGCVQDTSSQVLFVTDRALLGEAVTRAQEMLP